MVALSHRHWRDPIGPWRSCQACNHAIDYTGNAISQFTLLVPEIDTNDFLPFSPVGKVPIPRDEP